MKYIFLTLVWLFVCSGVILSSIATVHYLATTHPQIATAWSGESSDPRVLGTVTNTPIKPSGMEMEYEVDDARAKIVANFLERHNSPLQPYDYYGEKFVEIADRYEIDFRLVPAIAMQESNLCKVIPEGSNNCLGFGVHSRGTLGFDKYEDGFERAARELKKNYIDIGLTTPEQIMTKYTPSSNGSWANSVNQWMAEMRYDDRSKGRTEKTDANLLEFVGE